MGRKSLLTIDAIEGAFAIVPTPAIAKASDWRVTETIDFSETERVVEALIASGVNGILGLGTLGECATLTWDEKRNFVATVVEVTRGRVPLFFGTTSLNTRETVRQTREFRDIGVDGTMLGIPMWCAPDLPVAVQFYRDIAEACPDTAICVYANTEAFRFDFPPPFWAQVSELPQVITAKYINLASLALDLHLSKHKIRLLPIDMDYYSAARIDPEFMTAFWTSGAVCGPTPVLRLRDEVAAAKQSGDWTAAQALSLRLAQANAGFLPNGSFKEFSKYNIGLEKARMDAAGWMTAGPPRPPYHLVPEPYLANARAAGMRWAELNRAMEAEAVQPAGDQAMAK
jgi:trans-o-hydroxybenzylidenepyruvate hydratase-aldolase